MNQMPTKYCCLPTSHVGLGLALTGAQGKLRTKRDEYEVLQQIHASGFLDFSFFLLTVDMHVCSDQSRSHAWAQTTNEA